MKSATTPPRGAANRRALSLGGNGLVSPQRNDRLAQVPKTVPVSRLKLLRQAGQPSVFSGGQKITRDDVRRLLEDET